ncbi:hypothetical protein FHS43_000570 [Streptosporangium becharense]|uniref:Phage tail protein n=1 Tax=Streptosporangium becharense TaxID=1816182 RepID=A0A7W9IN47_9ACTN|nr:phage tail tube protein [Streptosporangium becharense]MBB2909324.1 hypothetical protein [Streptosporangium becharense]MBB5823773.1 hypothetical protein [Streptosporangium becharense]
MTTGTGLDSQVGIAAETTVGTAVTVTRFLEYTKESMKYSPGFLEPSTLAAGTKYKRVSRVTKSRVTAGGDLELPIATRGMGLLYKHMIGSTATATQIGSTTAYRQVHTPVGKLGLGFTMQVGRPEPSTGTVRPFTYRGCKVTEWEFSLSDNDVATLKLSIDAMDEATATALATASYTSAHQFGFHQAALKLGGTVATASGVTSVTGGTAVATVINSISIKGSTPLATERYGLGSGGIKREPLENDIPTITGSLKAEFSQAELYDVFKAGDALALQLDLTGAPIGASGEEDTLSFICPAIILKEAPPVVDGPGIVMMDVAFEAYSDGTNPVLQLLSISADTTL